MSGRGADAAKKGLVSKPAASADDVAAYAFDMLQSLRGTCADNSHHFLSYLIGMAAEEAQRLSEGLPSAASDFGEPARNVARSKKH